MIFEASSDLNPKKYLVERVNQGRGANGKQYFFIGISKTDKYKVYASLSVTGTPPNVKRGDYVSFETIRAASMGVNQGRDGRSYNTLTLRVDGRDVRVYSNDNNDYWGEDY